MIRLDRFISETFPATRSEAKKLIASGKVSVNGITVKKPEAKLDEIHDEVECLGKRLSYKKGLYFMLSKPAGVISATKDEVHKTVIDLFPAELRSRIFPVGRLDIDTEGLLLVTDDGDFCHRLESPAKGVFKKYFAKTKGKIADDAVKRFKEGIEFSDYISKPAELEILLSDETEETYEVLVRISEGRFHQVKRMLNAVGTEVVYLKRVAIGELTLDENLAAGEYRELTEKEIALFDRKK